MKSYELREKFLNFYKVRGHVIIPSAPLVPENDPTTLFNSAGMQPLIQYILGEPHPAGKRLVNSQKAVRTQDIEEVGDNRHITFFEMLGNWSLGDYFKEEQLFNIFTFLTRELGLPPQKLYVSVFSGDKSVSIDTDSINIWKELFSQQKIDAVEGERIFVYPASKNWWSRAGEPEKMPPGEPGGPDSEIFYDFGPEYQFHEKSQYRDQKCHPNCDCGRFLEIANSVFMQYKKEADGSLSELPAKVVDFGGGLERQLAAQNGTPDIFMTDSFKPIIGVIEEHSRTNYQSDQNKRAMRIIADHMRGSVMIMADGVVPANKQQGYILRRLLRRSILYSKFLSPQGSGEYLTELVDPVMEIFNGIYPDLVTARTRIRDMVADEIAKFNKTLDKGLKEIEKEPEITGEVAFRIYETYGFPWEMTQELAEKKGQNPDRASFEAEFNKHREKSRTGAKGMFKGGLADQSADTTRLHTATHLLHQSLRTILGEHVQQKGSNITAHRLRFDYSHQEKLSPEIQKQIEDMVNVQIKNKLDVKSETMLYDKAVGSGALAFFGERYPHQVKVYTIYDKKNRKVFSKEICGGPHVNNTGELGEFRIIKAESAGSGIRRIYAVLK